MILARQILVTMAVMIQPGALLKLLAEIVRHDVFFLRSSIYRITDRATVRHDASIASVGKAKMLSK